MTVICNLLTADSSDKGTVSRTTSSVKTEFAIRLGAGPDVGRKCVQLRVCGHKKETGLLQCRVERFIRRQTQHKYSTCSQRA